MREVLRTLPDNSMDSCVCDPPYELSDGSKQSPCRVAAKVLLPDNTDAEAEAASECELVPLAREIARLGGVGLQPGPSAAVPVGSVALDEQTANGQTDVKDSRPTAGLGITNADGTNDAKAKPLEYVGDFRLELADPESLVDALNCAGTGFFAGGIGIGFGVRPPCGPCPDGRGLVIDYSDPNVWALYDSLAPQVGARTGAEYESVARLDPGGGTKELLSARSALVLLGTLQTGGAKLVRASAATRGLPPVLQADRVRFVVDFADRALAFDVKLHTESLSQKGFMAREWDGSKIAFDVSAWRELYRVLKPGAHLVAFGGTRTFHRIACAIEDAGFQIRDSLAWLYGQGFPKSMDLSKAIDKAAGAEREVVGTRRLQGNAGVPTSLKGGTYSVGAGLTADVQIPITAAATDLAKKWEGWGTALKPCFEPIILARKPPIGTIAQNVAQFGVGGLNIDECRTPIEDGGGSWGQGKRPGGFGDVGADKGDGKPCGQKHESGRWPPNVACDEDIAADLDELYGVKKTGSHKAGQPRTRVATYGKPSQNLFENSGDEGGVSRYFYCPKANGKERDAGLESWPVLTGGEATGGREEGSAGVNNPRAGAGRGGGRRNPHPTVKPLALMRWLCKLVTPPGGFIIDPFAGSGTTGCAAALEGFHFAGIELDPVHVRLAMDRINYWANREMSNSVDRV